MYCNAYVTVHTMFPVYPWGTEEDAIKVYNHLCCICESTDAAFHLLVVSHYHLYVNIWIQHTNKAVVADLAYGLHPSYI